MGRITLEKINKSFGAIKVLHNVDLDIRDGEFIVFVGPSGCGKSTLLRQIAGLDKPTSGDISIDGNLVNDVPAADRGLAMVFQSYALYPHMSVKQNLAFGLENARMPKTEIENRIAEAARMLEIGDYLGRRPGQLSGGQRQRVAIGRAIVRNPTAFLLDEPLSNLDAELRISMRAELSALHKRLQTTMIYVTHDQIEAMTLANRIVVLRKGQIEQVGTPLELYNTPANRFVAGFIGAPSMNFLPGSIAAVGEEGTIVSILGEQTRTIPRKAHTGVAGQAITAGIRPQHIRIAPPDEPGIGAKVHLVEGLGSETVVHARASTGETLLAVLTGQHALASGEEIRLTFDVKDLHVFDENGTRLSGT
ncbi:sn-glycerol-3-phosphate ABC transporter ATP-binding protein UgpC [Phyllobacterium salinisoli]|uniref:sn-glycerol-3-phosphate ABC transporter ATP-binding protein UgpC n=1 Tax=Phyllobacterium salinisoli TaxID=1899321 RepID=A0A368K0H9_9HYPH|nr:sn-glycerol-3-phosphate ABC transporter ATP-binding protein UgpC [Phyllobacterium salinisoli]RCS22889.1 sn-glycerol-3-phosphate ABC transporter ATP-binding protein UgpC [Phyllobacterium salinisoli]